jgi:hypothetical protein
MHLTAITVGLAIGLICLPAQAQRAMDDPNTPYCMRDMQKCFLPERGDRYAEFVILFYRPKPDQLIYEPARQSPDLSVRQYVYAFNLWIRDSANKLDESLMANASSTIWSSFGASAAKALEMFSDTVPVGWIDEDTAICRAHKKKPSLVLTKPYFEDVEYCLRLISDLNAAPWSRSRELGDRSPQRFRIQSQITVTVTLNPGSPYRQPTHDEIAPYGKVLVDLVDATRGGIANDLRSKGWILENESRPGAISVTGHHSSTNR